MSAVKIKLVPIEEDSIPQEEQERGLTLAEFAAMGLAIAGALALSFVLWRKLVK